jgi:TolA-binding protein
MIAPNNQRGQTKNLQSQQKVLNNVSLVNSQLEKQVRDLQERVLSLERENQSMKKELAKS